MSYIDSNKNEIKVNFKYYVYLFLMLMTNVFNKIQLYTNYYKGSVNIIILSTYSIMVCLYKKNIMHY